MGVKEERAAVIGRVKDSVPASTFINQAGKFERFSLVSFYYLAPIILGANLFPFS
jgi:hypothetical protein